MTRTLGDGSNELRQRLGAASHISCNGAKCQHVAGAQNGSFLRGEQAQEGYSTSSLHRRMSGIKNT
eukprot:scaffold7387_cov408-Prasinococcus_capsulatus_cf.AAC.4